MTSDHGSDHKWPIHLLFNSYSVHGRLIATPVVSPRSRAPSRNQEETGTICLPDPLSPITDKNRHPFSTFPPNSSLLHDDPLARPSTLTHTVGLSRSSPKSFRMVAHDARRPQPWRY